MFKFVKKVFFIGLTILSNFTNVILLSYISMKNQECKVRPEIINVMNLYFILLVLKQINVVAVVIILMTHIRKYVFLMLQKI